MMLHFLFKSPSRITGIMIASIGGKRTDLIRRNGHSLQLDSPPPIQSCPTAVVLLPRSHLIDNRAVRS